MLFRSMTFSTPIEEYKVDPVVVKAMDKFFILHADHEQNASTSTVRLAGSSGANPFACIAAGIASLWGPAHGGANEAVINMLEEIESIDNINDHFNKEQLESFEICSLDKAIRNVHFTQDVNESREAIHRLKFDEHFFLQLLLALRKKKINEKTFDIIEFKTQKYNMIFLF